LREPMDSSEFEEPMLQREVDSGDSDMCPSCRGRHAFFRKDPVDAF
jgi:hypothetical protein